MDRAHGALCFVLVLPARPAGPKRFVADIGTIDLVSLRLRRVDLLATNKPVLALVIGPNRALADPEY